MAQPPRRAWLEGMGRFHVYSRPSWSNGGGPAGGYAGVPSGWESMVDGGLAALDWARTAWDAIT